MSGKQLLSSSERSISKKGGMFDKLPYILILDNLSECILLGKSLSRKVSQH